MADDYNRAANSRSSRVYDAHERIDPNDPDPQPNPQNPDDFTLRHLMIKNRTEPGSKLLRGIHNKNVIPYLNGHVDHILDDDPIEQGKTWTHHDLCLAMKVVGLGYVDLSILFQVPTNKVKRWMKGEQAIPLGICDYLRRRVANHIAALGRLVHLNVETEYDGEGMRMDADQLRHARTLLQQGKEPSDQD